jgi:hypothetical protein
LIHKYAPQVIQYLETLHQNFPWPISQNPFSKVYLPFPDITSLSV